MSVTMIGLDTAKAVFQLHGVDAHGAAVLKRKLRRDEVLGFFERQERCAVVLEACGAAHHWGRALSALGHDVRLIAPDAVRPFVKRGRKNDAVDAAAICAAAARPDARFVPLKSEAQQAVLALHGVRALLVKQRTALGNAMRGLAAEFGVVAPKGMARLDALVTAVEEGEAVPAQARRAMRALREVLTELDRRAAALEAEIVEHARHDMRARLLATIPGIGPLTASLISATVTDIGQFKSARHFAAWLGLVPRQNSTGGKTRLGRITKSGNPVIRSSLVLGATAMVYRAEQWRSAVGAWVRSLLARRPAKLVAVALAGKLARIAWAVMTRGTAHHTAGHAAGAAAA